MTQDGCTCQACGRTFRHDFLVPDDVWKRISPKSDSEGAGLLCGPCITERIEQVQGFGAWAVVERDLVERLVAALRQTEPCDGLGPVLGNHCPGTETNAHEDSLCRRCDMARDELAAARAAGFGKVNP